MLCNVGNFNLNLVIFHKQILKGVWLFGGSWWALKYILKTLIKLIFYIYLCLKLQLEWIVTEETHL